MECFKLRESDHFNSPRRIPETRDVNHHVNGAAYEEVMIYIDKCKFHNSTETMKRLPEFQVILFSGMNVQCDFGRHGLFSIPALLRLQMPAMALSGPMASPYDRDSLLQHRPMTVLDQCRNWWDTPSENVIALISGEMS
jgi:hypothetical protein